MSSESEGSSTLEELFSVVRAIGKIGTEEPEDLSTRAVLAPGHAMLLMEDSPHRAELVRLLEHQGYAVRTFESAVRASGLLRTVIPALTLIEPALAPGARDLIRASEEGAWSEALVIVLGTGPAGDCASSPGDSDSGQLDRSGGPRHVRGQESRQKQAVCRVSIYSWDGGGPFLADRVSPVRPRIPVRSK